MFKTSMISFYAFTWLRYLILIHVFCFVDCELDLGLTTKAALRRLNEAGVIKQSDVSGFHKAARAFLQKATEFAVAKLPVNDPLLSHAVFVDFKKRQDCRLDNVLYFVRRYTFIYCL